MKQKLYGIINSVKKLSGTINVVATKQGTGGAITSGFFIPYFYGGAKGFAGTPMVTKVLIDVDNYILKDSNNKILTVMEGDETWLTSTDS